MDARDGSFRRIPDGERPSPTSEAGPSEPMDPEPTGTAPRYVLGGDGTVDDCFHVTASGMPAIDVTGSLVATSEEQILQMSPLHGRVILRVENLDDAAASTTLSIVPDDTWPDDERSCRKLRSRARKQVAAANAELRLHRFRALEPLAVEYGNLDTDEGLYRETPAAERPLQVIVRNGEAIVRIVGVKVHERHPMPLRDGYSLYAVHGDRETGIVVLTFAECAGDSCTCDPLFTTEIVRWSPETFAALDAHPCTDPDAEDGLCRGIDYGF